MSVVWGYPPVFPGIRSEEEWRYALILKFIWLTRKDNGNRLLHKQKLHHHLPIMYIVVHEPSTGAQS